MVKVRLAGLKIARARGKYYVYVRATGAVLIRGFDGSKAALLKKLAEPGTGTRGKITASVHQAKA